MLEFLFLGVFLAGYATLVSSDTNDVEEDQPEIGDGDVVAPDGPDLLDEPVSDEAEPEDQQPDEPEVEEPEVTGEELIFDGSKSLLGTNGNDTLEAGQGPELVADEVFLGAGDDVAVVEYPFGTTVYGGQGDDELSSVTVGNFLEGGNGNDTIYGVDATYLKGGRGDDLIIFDSDVELNDSVAEVAGGAGDDTIRILANLGELNGDRGGVRAYGGAGEDSFEVILDPQSELTELDEGYLPLTTGAASIYDFDPAEDRLRLELNENEYIRDREVLVDMEQSQISADQFESVLSISLIDEGARGTEAVANVRIFSNAAFDLSDLDIEAA